MSEVIGKKIEETLNGQMIREFYSSYLYLSMSAYFETRNLKGFSHWLRVQAQEEWGHGMKFFNYLIQRGGVPKLLQIDTPPNDWKSLRSVFDDAYQHEQQVTKHIAKLVNQARSEGDHATEAFLQWFVTEQVEEEMSTSEIAQKMKLAGDAWGAIFVIDGELGRRASK